MLNFKFFKRASFFFALVFFAAGYSSAFAGLVKVWTDQDEKNFNQDNLAAAANTIPAKTDGEIADCFDYYRFPSVQTSFDALQESYEPGQKVYFKGNLINENDYPIADGYLFVRIARFNENYTREGHDIADEFFAKSGPQGREKFYLDGNEKKTVVFDWNVPENLPEGNYEASFSFVVGKKMNLAGLSFTNEVNAGSAEFKVKKSALGAKRVFLEKSSFAVNGEKYNHIGLWPQLGKGAKAEVAGKLKNETSKKENIRLVYDLYYWDGLDDKNKTSSRSEDITVAPNSSHFFKYVIPKMDETVYFLRVTAIAGNNQKSIVNLRLLSEQERPRINFFSPMKFPVLAGETMTNFVCFHNTAGRAANGKVTMNVFDESGNKVETLGYEGEITGGIMAVKKETTAKKNYGYLRMAASVTGADDNISDSYEMIYDCKNMDSENQDCVKIQEEKIKAAADADDSSDKKKITFGIAALAAILAGAFLLKKFFLSKAKPPIMTLFFALAVGLVAFLAGGAGNYVFADSGTVSENYNFPPDVDCDKPGQIKANGIGTGDGKICLYGNIEIPHIVERDNTNSVLNIGDTVNFTYKPEEPFYYGYGEAYDTPPGKWCGDWSSQDCRDDSYDEIGIIKTGGDLGIRNNFPLEMTWLAVKPLVSITSSDNAVVSCGGMKCTAQGKGDTVLTANIGAVKARPWVRVLSNKGDVRWEGNGEDTAGMSDKNFPGTAISWNISVDQPMSCSASFTPTLIESGSPTKFSWETAGDTDDIIPISCSDSQYDYSSNPNKGYFSISPTNTSSEDKIITCTATVDAGSSAIYCSADVTIEKEEKIGDEKLTVEIYGEKWTDGSTIAGGSVTGTDGFSCVGNKTTDSSSSIAVGADKLLQTCTKYYTKDTSVDLYASPASGCPSSGCGLKKWDGACSGGNCSFAMGINKTAKAYFKVTSGTSGEPPPPSSSSSATPPPSSSSSADPDVVNLTIAQKGNGNGSVSLTHMGSLDGTDNGFDSNVSGSSPWGLAKNYIYKITAAPASGSYLGGVSGGGCSDSPCTITMNNSKTVTVTFNSSSGPIGPTGPTGGASVKAYISAQDTVVSDGNSTVVTWTSDNATSCEQKKLDSDTGWINASDTASGSYTTSNFTTSGGARTYTITCTNGSQEADDSVTVSVGSVPDSPSINMWADPQSIGYKKTSAVQWLGSNLFPNTCLLFSLSDTMNGYLSYFSFKSSQYFGSGYYASVGENNTTGQKTGKLSGDTVYKIQCQGRDSETIKAQTTVAVAKPVSNFTFTNPSGGSLVATIVENLSANSGSVALALSGETIGNVNLSAAIPAISGAKAQFATSADNGDTWSAWSDTPLSGIDISATPQIKIRTINIPGATATGTYNVALTAKDSGAGGITKKLNIDLKVNKVTSEWKEF